MARFVLNGSGQYVDPNTGSVLIDSYKADGSGGFVNNQGRQLNSAPQPAAIRGQPQPSLRERAFTAAQENQRKYEEAVQSQMDQVLAGYKERRDAASKSLAKLGDVNIADINAKYDAMLGTARSRANATGMGATTAMAGTEALIERERQAALARARGSRTGMEIDTMSQLEGDRIRAIENMNIAPPDNSTLLELARMEGEATQQGLDAGAWGAAGGGGAVGLAPAMIGGSGYGGFASGGFNIPTAAQGFGMPSVGGNSGRSRSPAVAAANRAQANWIAANRKAPVLATRNAPKSTNVQSVATAPPAGFPSRAVAPMQTFPITMPTISTPRPGPGPAAVPPAQLTYAPDPWANYNNVFLEGIAAGG